MAGCCAGGHAAWLLALGLCVLPPTPLVVCQRVERARIKVDGVTRVAFTQYPAGDAPSAGWPVVFSFHGWGGTAAAHATVDGPTRSFGRRTAIVVHGEGWPMASKEPQSWHGAGSAGHDVDGGEDGMICNPQQVMASRSGVCYTSCEIKGYCNKTGGGANRCRWSHCRDDVAFVLKTLDLIKKQARVDSSRIFGTGYSNGGTFVYELASDPRSAGVFSAIAPVSGLPANGFNRGTPNPKLRCLNIEGRKDGYVHPFPNVRSDRTKSYGPNYGWYFSSLQNTTQLWAKHKGLREKGEVNLTAKKQKGLACRGWSRDGAVESANLAYCLYDGPHASPPSGANRLIWDFFGLASSDSRNEI